MASNPFHDLYLSEAISEDDLVKFFSPIIVEHAGVVFEPGNVVVCGLQGTGKTMLLNLTRPELRLAYHRAQVDFPVPSRASRFIGAGINLRKCGILEFAQHLEEQMGSKEQQELALLFADFFNYWVIADLLESIGIFVRANIESINDEIGLNADLARLDQFATKFALDPCWFGAFKDVKSLADLCEQITRRIGVYRKFLNLNVDELPSDFLETKTLIGHPILKAVEALRASGVIEDKTKVFIRIDQYEQLTTLNIVGTTFGNLCQELIHKALAARDGRVSYRIGTRTYGWDDRPAIYRTTDVLERKRDFDVLDMDEVFRRRENSATWRFPAFANDIFLRRMRGSEYAEDINLPTMSDVLGRSMISTARANVYASSPESRRKLITTSLQQIKDIPTAWKTYVIRTAEEDILAAWLAAAWVRQKSVQKKGSQGLGEPPTSGEFPWKDKPYWFKERVHHGMMQIASANRQAPMWSGDNDILNLSDGQILTFLFLMQHIWDAWLRDRRGADEGNYTFPIRYEIQSQGVREASNEWRAKQTEGPNAFKRKTFVDRLGEHLYISMTGDRAMSNPGENGFSVENSDLESNLAVRSFLRDAVSYGDLVEAPHTSKKKGERRTKYYLTPILSPYFRIPSVRTKEPQYVGSADVALWMGERSYISPETQRSSAKVKNAPGQQSLWQDENS